MYLYEIKAVGFDSLGYFWAQNEEHAWEKFYRFNDWYDGDGTEFCYIGNDRLHYDEFYCVKRTALAFEHEHVINADISIFGYRVANEDDDLDELLIFDSKRLTVSVPPAFAYVIVPSCDSAFDGIKRFGLFESLIKAQVAIHNFDIGFDLDETGARMLRYRDMHVTVVDALQTRVK